MKTWIMIFTLATSVPALASFRSSECSDSSGQYRMRSSWAVPNFSVNYWIVEGKKKEMSEVTSVVIENTNKELEERHNGVQGSRQYVEKQKISYKDAEGETVTREIWMLCTFAAGI